MRHPHAVAAASLGLLFASCAFAEDEAPAVVPYRPSVATSAELPAPGWPELEAGFLDYPGVHVDMNVAGVHIGSVDTGQGRWQGAWAVAAAHPLDERFAVTGELSGIAQHGTAAQTQALVALSYNVGKKLVLDVAVAAGLSRSATDLQVMTGFTVQLGHWF